MNREKLSAGLPTWEEIEIEVEVEEEARLFVYCLQCDKVLYCTNKVNDITNKVAKSTAMSHSFAYSKPHDVGVVTRSEGETRF